MRLKPSLVCGGILITTISYLYFINSYRYLIFLDSNAETILARGENTIVETPKVLSTVSDENQPEHSHPNPNPHPNPPHKHKHKHKHNKHKHKHNHPQLKDTDFIFKKTWDTPFVIKEYKLIFFSIPKVGCTEWKLLFRLMMGFPHHDTSKNITKELHNPKFNGLTYLTDFDIQEAQEMLTSDEWTRAVFVREPKERILSAFLDKFVEKKAFCNRCSHSTVEVNLLECLEKRDMARRKRNRKRNNLLPYFLETSLKCESDFRNHWLPQYHFIGRKWWPYINFVGYMDNNATVYAQQLLKSLKRSTKSESKSKSGKNMNTNTNTNTNTNMNAWDQYGTSGWGRDGEDAFLARQENSYHSQNAKDKLQKLYDSCTEAFVEKHWAIEWEGHDFYHFDKFHLFNETTSTSYSSGSVKEGCEILNRTESPSW